MCPDLIFQPCILCWDITAKSIDELTVCAVVGIGGRTISGNDFPGHNLLRCKQTLVGVGGVLQIVAGIQACVANAIVPIRLDTIQSDQANQAALVPTELVPNIAAHRTGGGSV